MLNTDKIEGSEWFVLDADKNPVRVSMREGAMAFGDLKARIVEQTQLYGDVEVSTVFLGLNHRYGEGPPLVFETLVFGGPYDGHMDRYSTWREAQAGHAAVVLMHGQFPAEWSLGGYWYALKAKLFMAIAKLCHSIADVCYSLAKWIRP